MKQSLLVRDKKKKKTNRKSSSAFQSQDKTYDSKKYCVKTEHK